MIHALSLAAAVSVNGAWSRPAVGNAVVYATIRNAGAAPVAVTGVRASVGTSAELHRSMAMAGGTMDGAPMSAMGMAPVKRIVVPAHGSVTLKPGGDHVMVLGLRSPLKAGTAFSVTFALSNGRRVTVRVPVENRAF